MSKKVALLGYAHSKKEINWGCKGEIWIMNDMYKTAKRFDRLFEIHSKEFLEKTGKMEGLKQFISMTPESRGFTKAPKVYMQENYFGGATKYPLELIHINFYNSAMGDKLFMGCTVSYMLALAIFEGFEEITLLGIDEAIDGEYTEELPSVSYWLGVATGKGIDLKISTHSPLLKVYNLYGYEDAKKTQINEFFDKELNRITEIEKNAIKMQECYMAEENKCIGAQTILKHVQKLLNGMGGKEQ
jgi:hypothetical protein